MQPVRAALLSSRIFWAITLVFCALEAAILATALDYSTEEDRLATQLAVTHQASGVAWRLTSTTVAAEAEPQLAWLESILEGLNHGGPVNTLDNTLIQLEPVRSPEARQTLTDAIARLGSATRLHGAMPGSDLVREEIRGLVPSFAQLGAHLAAQRTSPDDWPRCSSGWPSYPPPAASSPPGFCCSASPGGSSVPAGCCAR